MEFEQIVKRSTEIRKADDAAARDWRAERIRLTRAGKLNLINPDAFSEDWPEPIIANFINTAALDMAESLAPLPTLNCSSGSMNSEAAKKKASLKTKIGNYYWDHSNLKRFSVQGADWLFSYGFVPLIVEPDAERMCPTIRFEDPYMAYPVANRKGVVTEYVKVISARAADIAAMYPEVAGKLLRGPYGEDLSNNRIEVVRYHNAAETVMFVQADRDSTPLIRVKNPLGRVPIALAARHSLDGQHRGQYDDAIWVQIARARMASLGLEAGVKAVEAPTAVPSDMIDLPIGPDAIWRTESPEKIRRVPFEVNPAVWQLDARLEQEQMRSTRYPEARSGQISASVITGKGVQELMGSFDAQIRAAQDQFGAGLAEATQIAFEMDVKVFGEVEKTIIGVSAGAPYREKYTPAKAIGDDYTCEVTYGFAAGLAPNNAVVMMLQLLGASLVSREAVQKQLPFDVDPVEMNRAIVLERGRDAVVEGIAAYAQAIPAMAQQGMDPAQSLTQIATFLDLVRKGTSVESAAMKAFTPPEPTEEELAMQEQMAAMGGAPGLGGGLGPDGLLSGVAPGQAGMPPGGLPDIATMAASFRGGRPDMSASVQMRRAV